MRTRGTARRQRRTTAALLLSAGAALVVPTATSAGAAAPRAGIPRNPTRLATDNGISLDGLIAIGLKPACAEGPFNALNGPVGGYTHGIVDLGPGVAGTDFNVEALAACHPDGIVAPSYDDSGAGSYYGQAAAAEEAIAPTIFFTQPNPPVSASGKVESTWKTWLHSYADQLGRREQANEVIAKLDLRASAIRGQVAGRTIGLVSLASPSTFSAANDDLPLASVYVQDLGLKNFLFPPSDYASGCLGPKPEACYTNDLSTEELPKLDHVDALLVQSLLTTSSDIETFEQDPLFTAIPAVAAGHVAEATAYTDVGPIGVGDEYTAVDKAFGLREYHAAISGDAGGTASVTVDPRTGRLCWAIDPVPGARPASSVVLAPRKSPGGAVTLSSHPRYVEPDPTYETAPKRTFQAKGCVVAPAALERQMARSPLEVELRFAGGAGALRSGAASPVVS